MVCQEQRESSREELYKTVWEIKQRVVVDMAADRGAFIDQSQSLNLDMPLASKHFLFARSLVFGQPAAGTSTW